MGEKSTTQSDVTATIRTIMEELMGTGCNDFTQKARLNNVVRFYEYYNKCVEERIGEFDRIRAQLEQIIAELVREGKIGKTVNNVFSTSLLQKLYPDIKVVLLAIIDTDAHPSMVSIIISLKLYILSDRLNSVLYALPLQINASEEFDFKFSILLFIISFLEE